MSRRNLARSSSGTGPQRSPHERISASMLRVTTTAALTSALASAKRSWGAGPLEGRLPVAHVDALEGAVLEPLEEPTRHTDRGREQHRVERQVERAAQEGIVPQGGAVVLAAAQQRMRYDAVLGDEDV